MSRQFTILLPFTSPSRLPREFVSRCNAMNEVWVPSDFSRQIFIASSVAPSKLVIVPEGVNTTHFDPANFEPMPLPQASSRHIVGELVFGRQAPKPKADGAPVMRKVSPLLACFAGGRRPPPFRFLSTFKWEARKGWDVLLAAYLQEFTSQDNVELYIITKPFMSGSNFKQQMLAWARTAVNKQNLPTLYVVSNHVNDDEFPRFYRAVDAFVLPSRGEGWGRPHVEAMSMGLPVISTNWSGIQAYLDESVGYPINTPLLALIAVSSSDVWWFKGSNWAQPSIQHLRRLMRRVVSQPQEAKVRGKAARERMVREYSPEALGPFVAQLLRRADARIPQ
ncbi:hypothetical protein DUNSADRAFT_13931 [Dunaliella salina]|uniref:Glycosyltransferase n=1 Tax=Dunaliella salina TaxID=3046 RepID=A0ABQ7G8D9_DUNSA|nr:hypothetical protein DUNSADRAFT_13931 [Dunaliella salina]|eukprot:KAF5830871.1 hypothetical protein DUNSADRAFT_13931 [Dunaliella salina]